MGDIGYTTGERSKSTEGSILSKSRLDEKRLSEKQLLRIHLEEAGMATIVWNIIKHRLPPEVVKDFDDTIRAKGLPRMDAGFKDGLASIWSKDQSKEYRFSLAEAAPPRGACAMNYARFCHNEGGANKWIVALTTTSTADPKNGGNFHLAQYGVLSEAEGNTITCWRVKDHHGTTLYRHEARQNCGVALYIPPKLKPLAGNATGETYTRDEIARVPRPSRIRDPKSHETTGLKAEHVNKLAVRDTTPEAEDTANEPPSLLDRSEPTGNTDMRGADFEPIAYELDQMYELGLEPQGNEQEKKGKRKRDSDSPTGSSEDAEDASTKRRKLVAKGKGNRR